MAGRIDIPLSVHEKFTNYKNSSTFKKKTDAELLEYLLDSLEVITCIVELGARTTSPVTRSIGNPTSSASSDTCDNRPLSAAAADRRSASAAAADRRPVSAAAADQQPVSAAAADRRHDDPFTFRAIDSTALSGAPNGERPTRSTNPVPVLARQTQAVSYETPPSALITSPNSSYLPFPSLNPSEREVVDSRRTRSTKKGYPNVLAPSEIGRLVPNTARKSTGNSSARKTTGPSEKSNSGPCERPDPADETARNYTQSWRASVMRGGIFTLQSSQAAMRRKSTRQSPRESTRKSPRKSTRQSLKMVSKPSSCPAVTVKEEVNEIDDLPSVTPLPAAAAAAAPLCSSSTSSVTAAGVRPTPATNLLTIPPASTKRSVPSVAERISKGTLPTFSGFTGRECVQTVTNNTPSSAPSKQATNTPTNTPSNIPSSAPSKQTTNTPSSAPSKRAISVRSSDQNISASPELNKKKPVSVVVLPKSSPKIKLVNVKQGASVMASGSIMVSQPATQQVTPGTQFSKVHGTPQVQQSSRTLTNLPGKDKEASEICVVNVVSDENAEVSTESYDRQRIQETLRLQSKDLVLAKRPDKSNKSLDHRPQPASNPLNPPSNPLDPHPPPEPLFPLSNHIELSSNSREPPLNPMGPPSNPLKPPPKPLKPPCNPLEPPSNSLEFPSNPQLFSVPFCDGLVTGCVSNHATSTQSPVPITTIASSTAEDVDFGLRGYFNEVENSQLHGFLREHSSSRAKNVTFAQIPNAIQLATSKNSDRVDLVTSQNSSKRCDIALKNATMQDLAPAQIRDTPILSEISRENPVSQISTLPTLPWIPKTSSTQLGNLPTPNTDLTITYSSSDIGSTLNSSTTESRSTFNVSTTESISVLNNSNTESIINVASQANNESVSQKVPCNVCYRTFRSGSELKRHIKTVSTSRQYDPLTHQPINPDSDKHQSTICKLCRKWFVDVLELERHQASECMIFDFPDFPDVPEKRGPYRKRNAGRDDKHNNTSQNDTEKVASPTNQPDKNSLVLKISQKPKDSPKSLAVPAHTFSVRRSVPIPTKPPQKKRPPTDLYSQTCGICNQKFCECLILPIVKRRSTNTIATGPPITSSCNEISRIPSASKTSTVTPSKTISSPASDPPSRATNPTKSRCSISSPRTRRRKSKKPKTDPNNFPFPFDLDATKAPDTTSHLATNLSLPNWWEWRGEGRALAPSQLFESWELESCGEHSDPTLLHEKNEKMRKKKKKKREKSCAKAAIEVPVLPSLKSFEENRLEEMRLVLRSQSKASSITSYELQYKPKLPILPEGLGLTKVVDEVVAMEDSRDSEEVGEPTKVPSGLVSKIEQITEMMVVSDDGDLFVVDVLDTDDECGLSDSEPRSVQRSNSNSKISQKTQSVDDESLEIYATSGTHGVKCKQPELSQKQTSEVAPGRVPHVRVNTTDDLLKLHQQLDEELHQTRLKHLPNNPPGSGDCSQEDDRGSILSGVLDMFELETDDECSLSEYDSVWVDSADPPGPSGVSRICDDNKANISGSKDTPDNKSGDVLDLLSRITPPHDTKPELIEAELENEGRTSTSLNLNEDGNVRRGSARLKTKKSRSELFCGPCQKKFKSLSCLEQHDLNFHSYS